MTVIPGTSYVPSTGAAPSLKRAAAPVPDTTNPFQTSPSPSWLEGAQYERQCSIPTPAAMEPLFLDHQNLEAALHSPDASLMTNQECLPFAPRPSSSTVDGCGVNMDPSYSDSDAENWQANTSYTDTTEDSMDGFGNSHAQVHSHSFQTYPEAGSQDNDLDSHDMDDEEDPMYEIFFRRPIGFCVNCTQTLYSSTCGHCGHDSAQDVDLFSEVPSTSAPAITPAASDAIIIWHEDMLLHDEGRESPHPERPDRLRAVMSRLQASGLAGRFTRVPCREATEQELLAVHRQELVRAVESTSQQSSNTDDDRTAYMTPDTYVNSHTFRCAKLAAGGCAEAAVRVIRGEARFGAAIVRPPGHHAESNTSMGFCFFNNAAVAARAAQAAGARRIIILDWDVHHGNGTQEIFQDDPDVLYISLHRHDRGKFYPGTGAAAEVGVGEGRGRTINIPWIGSACDADYIMAFTQVVLPTAYEFQPDLILLSAGFDAAEGDPIGGCTLTPACYAHMTALLKGIAPMVLMLEGGYNLSATAQSTEACLKVLLGEQPSALDSRPVSLMAKAAIVEVMRHHSAFWRCLPDLPAWHDHDTAGMMRHPSAGNSDEAGPGSAADEVLGLPPVARGQSSEPAEVHSVAQLPRQSSAGGHGVGARLVRPNRRTAVLARKMQILRAVHNSAVRAFRRKRNMRAQRTAGEGSFHCRV